MELHRNVRTAGRWALRICLVAVLSGLVAGCGTSAGSDNVGAAKDPVAAVGPTTSEPADSSTRSTFSVDVWADNWMAVYVNGERVGEDSVPITTERSFNAETFTFEATYPFTIAIEAKDFKETDSGIEYIGQPNQQIGDGGLIAQVTDTSSGQVVATTGSDWSLLSLQRAPLNPECVADPDPDATCRSESIDTPTDWAAPDFDDSSWTAATEWTTGEVSPKDGYDEISWDSDARLIWGPDLKIDNTLILRHSVDAPS